MDVDVDTSVGATIGSDGIEDPHRKPLLDPAADGRRQREVDVEGRSSHLERADGGPWVDAGHREQPADAAVDQLAKVVEAAVDDVGAGGDDITGDRDPARHPRAEGVERAGAGLDDRHPGSDGAPDPSLEVGRRGVPPALGEDRDVDVPVERAAIGVGEPAAGEGVLGIIVAALHAVTVRLEGRSGLVGSVGVALEQKDVKGCSHARHDPRAKPVGAGPPVHDGKDLRPCFTGVQLSHHQVHAWHRRGPPMSRSVAARRERERRARLWRRGTVLALIALVALVGIIVLPIGNDPDTLDPIEVSLVEYAFVPSDLQAMPGQTLDVTNDGAITHNLVIPTLGKGIELPPGGTGTLEVPAAEPGAYEIVCDLTGHQEAGMVGTIEIA